MDAVHNMNSCHIYPLPINSVRTKFWKAQLSSLLTLAQDCVVVLRDIPVSHLDRFVWSIIGAGLDTCESCTKITHMDSFPVDYWCLLGVNHESLVSSFQMVEITFRQLWRGLHHSTDSSSSYRLSPNWFSDEQQQKHLQHLLLPLPLVWL